MSAALDALALPGLRAHMGNWMFYITFMKMKDIACRIRVAQDIHSSRVLKELLQRQLSSRSNELKDYLVTRPQRFFNALVVGTYAGNPQWNELAIRLPKFREAASVEVEEGALGILSLAGTETFFAIDGQHRVVGIREAVKVKPSLGDEEVCVIFVAGVTAEHREDDPEGFERTRRLFTTLNRYAKPVSKRDIIALDEDDVIAIVTRQLVEEYPLFRDKVSVKLANNIPTTDKRSLTTIAALYDANDQYLRNVLRGWTKFKKYRPEDSTIEEFYRSCTDLWDALTLAFPPLKVVKDARAVEDLAGPYRNERGGHLLFRPVGLLLAVRVIKHHCESGESLANAVGRIAKAPMDLAKEPWVGLLWDRQNKRIITAPENQKAAERVLFYSSGGKLSRLNSDEATLKSELAGLLHKDPAQVSLRVYK